MSFESVQKALDDFAEAVAKNTGDVRELRQQFQREMTELAQRLETAPDGTLRGAKSNPVEKALNDPAMKALREGGASSAIVKMPDMVNAVVKSTVVGDTAGSSENGYDVAPVRDPGLANNPQRALSLLDFMARIRVTSNSFEYNRLVGYTNAADYQANEGATKPEGTLPTELETANIATIAHWIPASRQVLADAPALQQQISQLLTYGVRAKLEREIILGAGGAGQIAGLTAASNFTAYSGAASDDTLADAVSKAQATLDAAGWRAGVVIVHPNDWAALLRTRADAGAGVYLAGDWRNPVPPSIWGVPVITNSAVSAGNFICMDPSQVLLLDRQDARLEVGTINDQFTRNVVTLLAELRAGLAVLSPTAVIYGDYEP